jgi:hypothetical protein
LQGIRERGSVQAYERQNGGRLKKAFHAGLLDPISAL